MVLDKKKENPIRDFYTGLSKKEKGRFLLWTQILTSFSQATVISRIHDNKWRPLERRAIERGIITDEWKELR